MVDVFHVSYSRNSNHTTMNIWHTYVYTGTILTILQWTCRICVRMCVCVCILLSVPACVCVSMYWISNGRDKCVVIEIVQHCCYECIYARPKLYSYSIYSNVNTTSVCSLFCFVIAMMVWRDVFFPSLWLLNECVQFCDEIL